MTNEQFTKTATGEPIDLAGEYTDTGHLIGGVYYGRYWGDIYRVIGHGYDDATGVMVEHLGGRTANPIGEIRSHRTGVEDDQLLNDQLLGLLRTTPLRR